MSQPRAVLTIYLVATALGALSLFITRAPMLTANLTFAGVVVAGLVVLLIFERIEPALSGDPPLVLIPGGAPDWASQIREAHQLSHNLTVLLAPRQTGAEVRPTAAEVTDLVAALAEDAAAVRGLLERGLGDSWWQHVNRLNRALRLTGTVIALYDAPLDALPQPAALPAGTEAQAEAAAALRRAKLVVLGPGKPDVNLLPALAAPGSLAALQEGRADCLWVGEEGQAGLLTPWLGKAPQTAPHAEWPNAAQQLLLAQAASRAKTAK